MFIDLKTEYTFGKVFGPLKRIVEKTRQHASWAGMADLNSTWGHVKWQHVCKEVGIKPIYGVRLQTIAVGDLKVRKCRRAETTLVALNSAGLAEIYQATTAAFENFYYWPRFTYFQLNNLSNDVAVIVGPGIETENIRRHAYKRIAPNDPIDWQRTCQLTPIACVDNYYIEPNDKVIYEPFADERKLERKTGIQYIPTYREWSAVFPQWKEALANLNKLADACNAELPVAPMITYGEEVNIEEFCRSKAKSRGVDLSDPIYAARFEREIKLIKEKDYVDYFFIVADLIEYAKKRMVVGPARGSSAGSLVCFIMGITEIDPIPYDLFFERFIDVNRLDLPDIDVDFQDDKRHLILNYLQKKYGAKNVAQIGSVNTLKSKSAINRFSKSLGIPLSEIDEIKEAIVQRFSGDVRATQCIQDIFNESTIGKKFIKKYPNMKAVEKIEGHASHTGIHAAGIVVGNQPVTNFASISNRNGKNRIAMVDFRDAQQSGMLKIDVLGLRTLTIFANICDSLEKPYTWLYEIPLEDQATYEVFNQGRLAGIFQIEGIAIRNLIKEMPVENIEDISALVAIARPGPLASGGAKNYIKYRRGDSEIKYISDNQLIIEATKKTYGVIIYQEQVLEICRNYGGLSWSDTSQLRKALSKSYGEEFFDRYKDIFLKGAIAKGEPEESALKVWEHINTYGSYGFNKSHSVSYGLIAYTCAYLKAHYPMEFAIACLNHTRDDLNALKLLRDFYENEGIEYVPFDIKHSQEKWSVHNDKLYGGLTTLHGIGSVGAKKVLKLRDKGESLPAGLQKKIDLCDTPFEFLYPARDKYGEYYTQPEKFNISREIDRIKDVQKKGTYCVIGCIIHKKVKNLNETINVAKRGGEFLTGPTTVLNITLEDDTDHIVCKIDRFVYNKLGQKIAESGRIGKDWYLVFGVMKGNFRMLHVKNIKRITK